MEFTNDEIIAVSTFFNKMVLPDGLTDLAERMKSYVFSITEPAEVAPIVETVVPADDSAPVETDVAPVEAAPELVVEAPVEEAAPAPDAPVEAAPEAEDAPAA